MSGPIVRTGTTPKFWENWDRIFGDDAKDEGGKAKKKPAKSSAAKKKKKKPSARARKS